MRQQPLLLFLGLNWPTLPVTCQFTYPCCQVMLQRSPLHSHKVLYGKFMTMCMPFLLVAANVGSSCFSIYELTWVGSLEERVSTFSMSWEVKL